uniref:Ninjurin 2 n=1 Tax=Seriola dumerili TaxID=41447 RepID=A0A3B4TN58_SERDU
MSLIDFLFPIICYSHTFDPNLLHHTHTHTNKKKNTSNLNMNLYATKKTAAEGMLDIALFLANITHMKTVIEQGAGYRYYVAVLTLISFSLALQIVAGILIIIIARRDVSEEVNQKRLDSMNNITTILVFLIFVTNIFISVFGMERTGLFPRMHF